MSTRANDLRAPTPSAPANAPGGWSSRFAFILAAAGSAVGLGNIWKFPYIAGQNGGGAFVWVYLACVLAIGLPILIAEIAIGRRGGASPIHALRRLAGREGNSPRWQLLGWLGVLGTLLILSFYSVVAGWSVVYLGHALVGRLVAADAASVEALFGGMLASPGLLLSGHTLIIAATVAIVAKGIRNGLERTVRWMVPGLMVLLAALVVYAATATGEFAHALAYVFRPNFSMLTREAVLVALGHACFTLSVGMTAMMAYGRFVGKDVSIGRASVTIAGVDTLVALLACLAIFPIVFAHGLEPGSGAGLVFVTVPLAFAQMPGGDVAVTLFFLLLGLAALTSAISLLEPTVEYLEQRSGWNRRRAALCTGLVIWIVGVGCALAFNVWSGFTILGKNLFDAIDIVTSNVMLPVGGLLIAVYGGWVLSRESMAEELGIGGSRAFALWRFALRYVATTGVALVLVFNLVG